MYVNVDVCVYACTNSDKQTATETDIKTRIVTESGGHSREAL